MDSILSKGRETSYEPVDKALSVPWRLVTPLTQRGAHPSGLAGAQTTRSTVWVSEPHMDKSHNEEGSYLLLMALSIPTPTQGLANNPIFLGLSMCDIQLTEGSVLSLA